MIRAVLRWLRVAAPPRWAPLLLAPVIVCELAYAWTRWRWPAMAAADQLERRDRLWLVAALVWGAWRAREFHPLFNDGYRAWLQLTPWTSRVPLPLGPVHLVLKDILWLGLALIFWHDPQLSPLYLPLCFLFAYLCLICISCAATGEGGIGCVLAIGLGEVLRQWYKPQASLTIAVWLYLAGWVGLRRSLARFPWAAPGTWQVRSLQTIAEEQKRRMLGWPLDQLHTRHSIGGFRSRALASVLVGWWCYCGQSLITLPQLANMLLIFLLFMASVAMIGGRTTGYWIDYRPPISFWGRLWTFRWIIPRYDHILVTPFFMFLVAYYLPGLLTTWRVPGDLALVIAISLVLLMGLSMPPSFERWRLTGYHRIVAGSTNKQEFEKI